MNKILPGKGFCQSYLKRAIHTALGLASIAGIAASFVVPAAQATIALETIDFVKVNRTLSIVTNRISAKDALITKLGAEFDAAKTNFATDDVKLGVQFGVPKTFWDQSETIANISAELNADSEDNSLRANLGLNLETYSLVFMKYIAGFIDRQLCKDMESANEYAQVFCASFTQIKEARSLVKVAASLEQVFNVLREFSDSEVKRIQRKLDEAKDPTEREKLARRLEEAELAYKIISDIRLETETDQRGIFQRFSLRTHGIDLGGIAFIESLEFAIEPRNVLFGLDLSSSVLSGFYFDYKPLVAAVVAELQRPNEEFLVELEEILASNVAERLKGIFGVGN